MSRITVKYRPSVRNNGTIVYNLAHNGETMDIDPGLKLQFGEWDNIISRVVSTGADKERGRYLSNISLVLSRVMQNLEEQDYDYSLCSVAEAFKSSESDATLKQALERYLDFTNVEARNTKRYLTAVGSLLKFKGADDI